jgi:hypothetical protein
MKQLLREFIGWDLQSSSGGTLIKESSEAHGGRTMMRGIIQRANTKNHNNRIYPRMVLQREADTYMKAVRENRAMGELDHPETATVSLDRVSHVVREMEWKGDELHGMIEVLDTPKGQILKTLINSNITFGISSRGVGSTTKNESGCDMVQDDFNLVAFDIVSEPSTPGAFLGLHEGRLVEWDTRQLTRPDRVFRSVNTFLTRNGRKL